MQVLQDKKFFSETVYKATGQRSYYKLKEFSIYQHVPGIFPKSELSWNATSAKKIHSLSRKSWIFVENTDKKNNLNSHMRNRDIQQSSRHDLAPNPFKRQLHKMVKHTQTICGLLPMPTNYLSLFDHFVGLVIKGLITLFFFL